MHPKKNLLYVGNRLAGQGLSPTTADTLPPELRKMGYDIIAVSSKKNKLLRLLDMVNTVIQNRKHIDLVIIDTYSTLNFYYAVIIGALCRRFNIPYVPVLHGGNLPQRLEKSRKTAKKIFKNAYVNVAPSYFLLTKFKESGFHNLTHIPNTIPIKNYSFKPRTSPAYKLLWVRSFADIYNPEMALEVMQLLKEKGHTVSLCMVGPDKDGSLEQCKTIATQKNLDVQFPGMLSKEAWIKLSEEYDIFINTTNFDNTPVSVIEVMALGLPVVSTNVGGLPYLIEDDHTGILTPSNDPKAMAAAITSLAENPDKATKITWNAREMVEKFDWEVVKEQWRELIDSVNASS